MLREKRPYARYDGILPLVCASCGHNWTQLIKERDKWVPCPGCGASRSVHVLPPVKIVDFNRANHYNQGASEKRRKQREDSPEPERVLRAGVLEPDAIDIEIIEEIG